MRNFGPLRNLWEGGVHGEGFLRYVKPMHTTIGLRYEWYMHVLERVIKKKILGMLSGGHEADDLESNEDAENEELAEMLSYEKREFFKYQNDAAALQDYVASIPLSAIVTECGKIGMVTRSDVILLLQKKGTSSDIVLRGLTFIHWTTEFVGEDGTSRVISSLPLASVNLSHACLLLPHPNLPNRYYAIRSDWKEMSSSTEFN